jgi:isoleucyl-tRNA synthetase
MFNKVSPQVNFSSEEEAVAKFWTDNRIFEKSLEQRQGAEEYVFYDGPPFATGLPHYGHLLAGTIKDVVPRYHTMRGKYVERVFGWDCHGLPVENEMEKELGIKSKTEIEEFGVDKFNEACRNIVLRYTAEWERVVHRMGRWVDFEKGYRTMDESYMESIWWVFKTLWDKDLIYEGHKILPYCPRCATPLSNFEATGEDVYREVSDPSVTIRFKVLDQDDTYILAWTTTPWTLASNLALTVGPDIEYVTVEDDGKRYILAANRVAEYFKDEEPKIVVRCTGKEMVGWRYEPLLPYFAELASEGAFRVIDADFVTTNSGTGVVHTAPGFGEDDAAAAKVHGVPTVCPVDAECKYTSEVTDWVGRFVKDCDRDVIQRLKDDGSLVHRNSYNHSYPHCWRCSSPLIYRAISTWFVSIDRIKPAMLEANSQIRWVPGHIKDGRFGKWLENARDWAISRNRYWGCPMPIWRNEETGEAVCVGSVAELEELTGNTYSDIHKHFVDDAVIKSSSGAELRRVPEVLDCWFESGSMPYAQRHYPFNNREWLENHFPADFIAEGLDQTRGWFYTLIVLGAALFDKPAFKNVVVNGLILAEDGTKMSKSKGNYPPPDTVIDQYGADALRLCLLASPVVRGEDLKFSEAAVKEVMRTVMLPLWNAYCFLVNYAHADGWTPDKNDIDLASVDNLLDQWILSRLEGTVADITESMEAYELQGGANRLAPFVDDLTNWYIRRNRRRFWKSQDDQDKDAAYATLYHVLVTVCKVSAPFIPFMTETIYQNLRTPQMPESVHLCDFPKVCDAHRRPELDARMANAMTAVCLGRYLRRQAELRTRQPLRAALLVSLDAGARADLAAMQDVIAEELNVKSVAVHENEYELVHLSAKANFKRLGPKLGKNVKLAATAIEALSGDQIDELRGGGSVTLVLDGGDDFEVTFEDIEIRRHEKEGLAVANEGQVTVALDMELDDELINDGLAREVINRVQNMRKEMGFDVSDRIVIEYLVPEKIEVAIGIHRVYICSETLADSMTMPEALEPDGISISTVEINEWSCRFRLIKMG